MTNTPENADPSPPDAPADADELQPRRRSRLTIALVATGLAVVLVALSLVGARILGWWPSEGEPEAGPTSPPAPSEPPSPFAGTPAEDFAEGADGIVLPEVEPVGDFTAVEVAEALEQVRRALIAARLDHTMLIDHDPDEFLALLAPDQQATVLEAFEAEDTGEFATKIVAEASLATATPRVEGEMSYQTDIAGAQDTEILVVVTRFVWVYAFETPDVAVGHQLVVVHDRLEWEVRSGEPWLEPSRGLWLPSADAYVGGGDCDSYQDGLFRPGPGLAAESEDDTEAIFDPERPVDSEDGC